MKFRVSIHANQRVWYRYLIPRRLTVKSNPAIYRWTFFAWSFDDSVQ